MGHYYVKEDETFNTSRNGTVPKPTQEDIEGNKVLKADGSWGEGGGGGASSMADLTDVDLTGLSDGDTLVYDDQEEKFVPGSSGNVNDVKVNGESVVDEDKVAKIISYKELTRAEYDALPDTKLADGVMYCIKDAPGSSPGFPPLIYSTEEREVGVWVDGKPLYQKTINFGALPNKTTKTIAHNINDVNGQSFCKIEVILSTSSTGYSTFQRVHDRDVKYQAFWEVTSTGIICYSRENDNSGYIRCFITLTYTKTTDTPGSGTWTIDGTYAKHYSTEEKVIGTWINGKPLYEKVLIPTGLSTDTADEDFAISNVDEIISCDGRISNTSNTLCTTTPFIVNNEYRCGFQANVLNSTTVRCRSYYGSQSSSYRIKAIILKYTKTTD